MDSDGALRRLLGPIQLHGTPIWAAWYVVLSNREAALRESVARVRPRTYESWMLIVNRHILPSLGTILLQKVGPQNIQTLLNRKLAEGLSPQTVRHIRTVLSQALREATKFGIVTRNAASLVPGPRVPHHEIRPLTIDQARRLVEAAKGGRLEALYSVAVAIGLRRGVSIALERHQL